MSVSVNGTNGLTFNDATTQNTSAFYGGLAMRNRIINGAMVISQRNAGASVTPTTANPYTIDRWRTVLSQNSKFTLQQTPSATESGFATRVAAGFTNYLAITSSSAYSITSGDFFFVQQPIEGFNSADLAWGTASAQSVTLSFWVRSSLTGTFGGSLQNSSFNRSYPFTYTVSAANTWEQKSVTIVGDTSGTWATDNSAGVKLQFGFGVGSTYSGTAGAWAGAEYYSATGATSVVGTSGATFYITGVQLEKGSTATSFDYRPYGTELALCQRYYWKTAISGGGTVGGAGAVPRVGFSYPQVMRATPTLTYVSGGSFSDGVINPSVTGLSGANANEASASIEVFISGTSANSRGGVIWATVMAASSEL